MVQAWCAADGTNPNPNMKCFCHGVGLETAEAGYSVFSEYVKFVLRDEYTLVAVDAARVKDVIAFTNRDGHVIHSCIFETVVYSPVGKLDFAQSKVKSKSSFDEVLTHSFMEELAIWLCSQKEVSYSVHRKNPPIPVYPSMVIEP